MISRGKREAPRPEREKKRIQQAPGRVTEPEEATAAAADLDMSELIAKTVDGEKKQERPAANRQVKRSDGSGSRGTQKKKREDSNFVWSLKRFWRRHRGLAILGIILTVLLCLILVGTAVWKSIVKPPDLPPIGGQQGNSDVNGDTDGGDTDGEQSVLDSLPELNIDEEIPGYVASQKEGLYTFLVMGRSDEDNYTDMIMLVVFDSNTGDVDIASIPRDLMVNLSRDIKKINSVSAGGNVTAMKNWVRKTLGIQPNFYVLVDWQAVGDMVDAVGGVYYNVPFRMHYVDTTPETGFTIDLQPGYQLLDGDKAMQVIRWRKNNVGGTYAPGDSARMKLQQQFIRELAYQFLRPQNLTKIGAFATIFKENVETDLSLGNLVWFGTTALELGSTEKLTFHTLPGNYENSCWSRTYKHLSNGRYQSYVTLYPNQLIEMVNTYLNPYEYQISLSDLDLMSCTDRHIISSSTGVLADTEHEAAYNEWYAITNGKAYYDADGNLVYVNGTLVDTDGDGVFDGLDSNGDGTADYAYEEGAGIIDAPDDVVASDPDAGGETTDDPQEGGDVADPANSEDPGPGEGDVTDPTEPAEPTEPEQPPLPASPSNLVIQE